MKTTRNTNLLGKSVLSAVVMLASTGVMAQENGNRDASGKIVRGPYETNRLFDNIWLGVGGGVNIYHGENDSYGSFGKRLAPALDLHVGKWITPSVGLRLGYSGINAKGWTTGQTMYAKNLVSGDIYDEKFGVSYLHGDVMWNFSNAVSGYKETRTWNFVPFVGAGWARSYGNGSHDNEFAVSIGLLNNIRLSNLLDLTLEARHMFVNQRFDGVARGSNGEGMTSVTLGLSFKLNRRGRNKTLLAENEALRNRQPEKETVSSVSASPVVLFFAIGKATLDKKELTNLEFYVKHAIKADKNKIFTLIGSADKATGSKELNQRLSEQRMQYVYDLLTNKYGIPADRLKKRAEGDTKNRFAEPELNRAVIVE